MNTMTLAEYQQALRDQGVSAREHAAVRCACCGTVQSLADFIAAGVPQEKAELAVTGSCIGRYTGALEGKKPARGCDWTLSGLFSIHRLEVVTPEGEHVPAFEPATPEEAQAHEKERTQGAAT